MREWMAPEGDLDGQERREEIRGTPMRMADSGARHGNDGIGGEGWEWTGRGHAARSSIVLATQEVRPEQSREQARQDHV